MTADPFEKIPEIDLRKLHNRKVTLRVMEESGYLILHAIDDRSKEIFVLSIEKDEP